jgi:hypothetical protein
MLSILNWNNERIQLAKSKTGVLVTTSPWKNLVRGRVTPWPPPELLQKVYQRHRATFQGEDAAAATRYLGYYSDIQSLNSEDALTWSVFGPIAYGPADLRSRFAAAVFRLVGIPQPPEEAATIWLWRRLPHPDTLVSGGPEVDFGIQTQTAFLIGEAKWKSKVARGQGKDKSQLVLRQQFCEKYGRSLIGGCRHFIVLAVSRTGDLAHEVTTEADGVTLRVRDTTWDAVVNLGLHPEPDELRAYLDGKVSHTFPESKAAGSTQKELDSSERK